jgi:hypothetical protein
MLVKFLKYLIHHIPYNQVQTYPLIYKQYRRDFIFYLFIYLVLLFTYKVLGLEPKLSVTETNVP